MKKLFGTIGLMLMFFAAGMAQQSVSSETMAQRFAHIWYHNPQEKVYLHTDKHLYSAGETIWIKSYLVNATTHQPSTKSNYVYVELLDSAMRMKQRVKFRRDGAGAFGMIKLPADYSPGEYTLRAYTSWMQNAGKEFFFHKKISLGNLIDTRSSLAKVLDKHKLTEEDPDDFDVQFFAESGTFLTGILQSVAFKAIASNGLSEEIRGTIVNQNNEEVAAFTTAHLGMGKVILMANPGDRFTARVTSSRGKVKQVELPLPVEQGIGLNLSYNRSKINFTIANTTPLPIDSLRLLIHCRGEVILHAALSKYEGQLPESILPAGISSFSVIDASNRVWCERLYFSRNFIEPLITMQTDKETYLSREPVELSFMIQKADSTPLPGSFSVSVTDVFHVQHDTINDDLRSYLLLSSDLRGYIESPQHYFNDNSMQTREKTDLLMLTQGWRRFNTAEIALKQYPENKYFMEVGQAISGKVYNLFKKPVKGNNVILLNGYKNKIRFATTDSLGQFYFDGIEFPDSTNIMLKAMSKSKIVDVEVVADAEQFPSVPVHLPDYLLGRKPISEEYLLASREKYYIDGGMMVIDLSEVTVSADKKTASSEYYYSSLADNRLDAKRLADLQGMRVLDILSMLPGVEVNGDNISIRGSGKPLFIINGIETEFAEDITYLNVTDVEEIMLFKGPSASIFGSKGGNGAIAFTLKQGYEAQGKTSSSYAAFKPLGFQNADEFYVPRYDVDSILKAPKRDLRTTVYWNPEVQPDSTGRVSLKFYTADNPNDYRVQLEGLGHNGTICRFKGTLRRQ
jgi:hypothetical protein